MPWNRKTTLVVFSGMDGAGKSTQIELLTDRYTRAGYRPKCVWARGGYTPGMEWLKRTARRCLGHRVVPAAGPSPERTKAMSRSSTRRWWLRLAILDLILLYAVVIRWWRLCGRPVICDRYWHDTELDFSLNFPQEPVQTWWLWRLLRLVAPRPSYAFLMLIPESVSLSRSQEKHEPFPDTPEVLRARLRAYRSWTALGTWHVMDGCRPRQELADEVALSVGLPDDSPAWQRVASPLGRNETHSS